MSDVRLAALSAWLETVLPAAPKALAPASADASFRRYFRVFLDTADGASTLIAMDAPPPHEDCRPFVHVAKLLANAGLNAPSILHADLDRGFLLLSDLGDRTYLDALDGNTAPRLFADAREALVRWQLASCEGMLPAYGEALLRRELELFPHWYLERHLGFVLPPAGRDTLDGIFREVIARALGQARVYVHRDFMPRNLMVCAPNPGILDFQDAVFGPISYDVVSLYRDAFVSWDESMVLDGVVRYWEQAKGAGLPVPADFATFMQDVEWMGLQRHLKVLGIFARINYRDGKPRYLADTPRFVAYVREVATRYTALSPLLAILDEAQSREPGVAALAR